jgi:4-amino-4-deoxy-L-arabinose transferase-like glycosyltransferase
MTSRRWFWALLPVTLGFRFWVAAVTPMTGDEAYFYWWGKVPDWGFYDHPPMIGWWLAALIPFGESEWWLRLPQVLQPAVIALAVAWALGPVSRPLTPGPSPASGEGSATAWWAALLVLLAPANIWNVFITTDTPLVYFAVFSALAWIRAARDDDRRIYLLAGALLAGAVLSKYFAALLGFAYLVDTLIRPRRRKWLGLAIVYASVLPALALMAWWNSSHCWPNYMFNFVNRHEDAGFSWRTPLLYAASLLYLFTPPVLWLLARQGRALRTAWGKPSLRATLLVGLVPLVLFAGLSVVKMIGLHWLLAFVPPLMLLLAQLLPEVTLRKLVQFLVGFAALHMLAFVTIAMLPLETWKELRQYDGIVLTVDTDKLLAELKPYADDYVFASDGYSNAVTYGYNARRYFIVFGEASSHARHDDILTDFRQLAGKNILILRKSPPQADEYSVYFRAVETRNVDVRGVTFTIVLGRGFNYATYRERILLPTLRKYYALPGFLPRQGCYFCDRYFAGMQCGN